MERGEDKIDARETWHHGWAFKEGERRESFKGKAQRQLPELLYSLRRSERLSGTRVGARGRHVNK
jgi:hypothetical protein